MAHRCPRTTAGSSGQADRRAPALELETRPPGKGGRVALPLHNRCCAVNDHVRGLHRVRTLSEWFGQQWVIESRTGAGSNIAAEAVVNAPPGSRLAENTCRALQDFSQGGHLS